MAARNSQKQLAGRRLAVEALVPDPVIGARRSAVAGHGRAGRAANGHVAVVGVPNADGAAASPSMATGTKCRRRRARGPRGQDVRALAAWCLAAVLVVLAGCALVVILVRGDAQAQARILTLADHVVTGATTAVLAFLFGRRTLRAR